MNNAWLTKKKSSEWPLWLTTASIWITRRMKIITDSKFVCSFISLLAQSAKEIFAKLIFFYFNYKALNNCVSSFSPFPVITSLCRQTKTCHFVISWVSSRRIMLLGRMTSAKTIEMWWTWGLCVRDFIPRSLTEKERKINRERDWEREREKDFELLIINYQLLLINYC